MYDTAYLIFNLVADQSKLICIYFFFQLFLQRSFARIGSINVTNSTDAEYKDVPIVKSTYERYSKDSGINDIAIVFLSINVTFTGTGTSEDIFY